MRVSNPPVTSCPFRGRGGSTAQHNPSPGCFRSKALHLQGHWNAFLGTPIADQWFVTAKHVGGSLGDTFHLMGQPYMAVVKIPDPESDLTLWGVSDPFPDVVPIYSGSQEAGRRTLLFWQGALTWRSGLGGGQWKPDLRGWKWGTSTKSCGGEKTGSITFCKNPAWWTETLEN